MKKNNSSTSIMNAVLYGILACAICIVLIFLFSDNKKENDDYYDAEGEFTSNIEIKGQENADEENDNDNDNQKGEYQKNIK